MNSRYSFLYETPHDRITSVVHYNKLHPLHPDHDINRAVFLTDKDYHLIGGVKYTVTVSYDDFTATIEPFHEAEQ